MTTLAFDISAKNALQMLETLKLFKGVKNVRKVARVEEIEDEDGECPICKANNYTLRPEVEAEILESLAELEEARRNGTLKSYTDMNELKKALLS